MLGAIHCNTCGKSVSSTVPDNIVIRAGVECPECFEKKGGLGVMPVIIETKEYYVIYSPGTYNGYIMVSDYESIVWGHSLDGAQPFETPKEALKVIRAHSLKATVKKVTVVVSDHYC